MKFHIDLIAKIVKNLFVWKPMKLNGTSFKTLLYQKIVKNVEVKIFKIEKWCLEYGILSKEGGRWFAGSVRSVYINGVLEN